MKEKKISGEYGTGKGQGTYSIECFDAILGVNILPEPSFILVLIKCTCAVPRWLVLFLWHQGTFALIGRIIV